MKVITLLKSVTHTSLILIPKKEVIESFSDLRPISLSSFINKFIFIVLHEKLEALLPKLISKNQSGFIKGKSIIENVLLTQEIVTDIRLRGKSSSVIIKLKYVKGL